MTPYLKTISITDLRDFSFCRRKWWLSETYEPKKPAPHFWIGTVVHQGLEDYYKNGRDFQKGLDGLNAYADESLKKLADTFSNTWDSFSYEFDEFLNLARSMFQNYCCYDFESPLSGEVWKTEQYVKIPIDLTDPISGEQICISGRIDLMMRNGKQIWVYDHKTAGRKENSYAGLDVDEQLTGYAWLAWKKYGVVPTAVCYNILLKELPDAPKVLKNGTLSQDTGQNTVYSLYLQEIQDRGFNVDDYTKMLTILQTNGWKRYFAREGSTRNETELRSFEARAYTKIVDIINIVTDPEIYAYPSPDTTTCNYCPFLGVCKSMDDGSDYQSILDGQFMVRSV